MNPEDVTALANHLWQSTLFAGVAGLLTLALRKNPARVRHWVWLAASVKFLIPFSVLIALGSQIPWRTTPDTTPSNLSVAVEGVTMPFTTPAVSLHLLATPPVSASSLQPVLWCIWGCGFVGIALAWWVRWRRIHLAVRSGSPLGLGLSIRAVSSRTLLEPGVFGVFRPVLLLPEGILERLAPAQLKAVIAHELCHIRHRDNLIAAFHMFVETVFWFHPMVWWIGKRMLAERELACDEEVIQMGGEPRIYAEGILNVSKLYVESPLRCVSGVTGSNLSKRIEAIMSNRVAVRLSPAKIAALAVAGMAALAAPIIVGMMDALPILAQAQRSSAQPAPAAAKFEVASVKPCKADNLPPGSRRGGEGGNSPGTLRIDCTPVKNLINQAYVLFANGHVNPQAAQVPVEGGPGWINSELYQIDAKAGSPQSQGIMRGPMLQRLLEERFKLKIRRETREVPAYALTVAKGGPKLRRFQEGSCTPLDLKLLEQFPPQPFPELPPGQVYCGGIDPVDGSRWVMASGTIKGPNEILYARALNIDEFIKMSLSRRVGRPVINKTGLTGRFDYHLEFAPDQSMPGFGAGDPGEASAAGASDPPGVTMFAALQQQLGLKLEPAKGTGEFLVIDQVERPSGNYEAAQAPAFEAASIKPAVIPVGREGGNRSRIEHTPTSLTMLNVNLNDCVQWAYGVAFFQVSEAHRSSESYDILAKTGTAVSVSQLRAMLQELLSERFKLAVHRESRMLPVYELVVAKGGPKLPAANAETSQTHAAESLPRIQNDSFLFQNASMAEFAQMLAQLRGVELPVIDRTGIAGNFDLVLKSGPSLTREGDVAGLFAIIPAQLGLKLVSAKAPIEVIVIDRAERPTEN